jgi:hypothetical protein
MGKGTLTINPFHSNRQLMSPVAMAGLLSTLVAFTDTKNREYIIWFGRILACSVGRSRVDHHFFSFFSFHN